MTFSRKSKIINLCAHPSGMTKRETAKKRRARPQSEDEDAQRHRRTQTDRDGRTKGQTDRAKRAKQTGKERQQKARTTVICL